MYAYAANNPVRYIDPDGRAWYTWFYKAIVWLGVNLLGEKSTRALYNASLSGKLKPNVVSSPADDKYFLASGMKAELQNIRITKDGEYKGRLLTDSIADALNGKQNESKDISARVSGKGKTRFGSDMELAIGGCTVSWAKGTEVGDTITVDITVRDTFDFEEKEKGERTGSGEFLTKLGRRAELKSAEINITFTATFKKNENGEYEYGE